MPRKKKRNKNKNVSHKVWTEEEFDEYMAGIYGFEYIAGYTDSGVPYGIPKEQEEKYELGKKVLLDDEELPFWIKKGWGV